MTKSTLLAISMTGFIALGFTFPTAMAYDVESLRAQFSPLGWGVEGSADGSILLIPPDSSPAAAPPRPVSVAPPAPISVPPPASRVAPPASTSPPAIDESALFRQIEEHGWQVIRHDDGSLDLYPPAPAAETTAPTRASSRLLSCSGEPPVAEVELPVDTWNKARSISDAWLRSKTEELPTPLAVGRIREIFGVYLVSIVAHDPPHTLHHQIAIRVSDGHVVTLY